MTRQQEDTRTTVEPSDSLSTADLVAAPSGWADRPRPTEQSADNDADPALMSSDDSARFQQRWTDVQNQFVDDPRAAVRDADGLVAEVMQSLAAGFAEHKGALEDQWSRDDEPDTEQLRQALHRYRSFFSRLLAT